MASFNGLNAFACFAFTALFLTNGVSANVTCENLDGGVCAFAVSSSGTRCVLEKRVRMGGQIELSCQASNIEAERNLKDWIETDECIDACGLDRSTVGISSDALLDGHFTQGLCSPQCYGVCPNIVDLYFNLAAGEGMFLPKLCEEQADSSRRGMAEIRSSSMVAAAAAGLKAVAGGPESEHSGKKLACGPAPSSVEKADAFSPALPPPLFAN